MLRVAKHIRPHGIVILGDFIDFEQISTHDKDALSRHTVEDELASANLALDALDSLGAKDKQFIEGNHESRFRRYLVKNAPQVSGLLSVQGLLSLSSRGWEWTKYRTSKGIGKLHITHDVGSAGKNGHRDAATTHRGSAIIGHTHRMAYDVTGTLGGSPYLAAMLGWLGNDKAADYIHQAKAAEWVHGFGIGYQEDNGVMHLQPVPIVKGKCVVNGRMFK